MAVSKRLRFEILRRDNHTCRYCGRSAPSVPLRVDHVVPVALGGGDEPANLVAACHDCNSGKSSVPAGAPLVDDVAGDALRWARAMQQAYEERQLDAARKAQLHAAVEDEWSRWKTRGRFGEPVPKPESWRSTVDQLLAAGLSIEDLVELVVVAMEARADDTWRYFCGCCWTRIRQLQDRAHEIVTGSESGSSPALLTTIWTYEQLTEDVDRAELVAGRRLAQESIDSAFCRHREWGEGDCGDPVCRIGRAEALGWMSDAVILQSMREDAVIEAAEALLDG